MDNRQEELSQYRIQEAKESLKVAEHCLREGWYKDSINRSYYAAFYAIKAVLALGTIDFKRHKDVVCIFQQRVCGKECISERTWSQIRHVKTIKRKK